MNCSAKLVSDMAVYKFCCRSLCSLVSMHSTPSPYGMLMALSMVTHLRNDCQPSDSVYAGGNLYGELLEVVHGSAERRLDFPTWTV